MCDCKNNKTCFNRQQLELVQNQARIARDELKNIRKKLEELQRIQKVYIQQCQLNNEVSESATGKMSPCVKKRSENKSREADTSRKEHRWELKPIGFIESSFKTKNATPRQPSVCSQSSAKLFLTTTHLTNPDHALEGIEEFSHLWLLFIFHKNDKTSYLKGKVAPPRLDGKRIGVFSSRSPHRPNPIGLSLVKLDKVEGRTLYLSGTDHVDGTPVIDIKPFIPAYDKPFLNDDKHGKDNLLAPVFRTVNKGESEVRESSKEEEEDGTVSVPTWVTSPPVQNLGVLWTPRALRQLEDICSTNCDEKEPSEEFKKTADIISNILREDPRSVYRRNHCKDKLYYFTYSDFHVTCWIDEQESSFEILRISKCKVDDKLKVSGS